MKIFIFGTDSRYEFIMKFLESRSYEKTDIIEESDVIILPFKGISDEGVINDSSIKIDNEFIKKLKSDTVVFTGVKNNYLTKLFLGKVEYYEFMVSKEIITKNSIATMEGLISHIIKNRNKTIYNSRFLVLGYGECGSTIANTLSFLGGKTDVIDRNEYKLIRANMNGVKNVTTVLENEYDVIINTIPRKIITKSMLNKLNKKTYLIDISSKPYGFDLDYANEIGIKSELLEKIPNNYAVETSGEILGEYILKIMEG